MPVAALRRLLLPGLCGNIRVCPHRRLRAGVPALRGRMWRAPGRSNVAGPGPLYPGPAQGGSEQAAATAHTGRFGRTPSGRRRRAAGTRRDVAAAILRGGEGLQEGLLAHVPPTPSGPPAGPAGACPRLGRRRPHPAKGLDRSAPLPVRQARPGRPAPPAVSRGATPRRCGAPFRAPVRRSKTAFASPGAWSSAPPLKCSAPRLAAKARADPSPPPPPAPQAHRRLCDIPAQLQAVGFTTTPSFHVAPSAHTSCFQIGTCPRPVPPRQPGDSEDVSGPGVLIPAPAHAQAAADRECGAPCSSAGP